MENMKKQTEKIKLSIQDALNNYKKQIVNNIFFLNNFFNCFREI